MDRLLKLWIESARTSSFDESSTMKYNSSPSMYHCYVSRPPPLRTSSTYDDDDAFNNVALNLLSRYETLALTSTEAILATLVDANQRSSFYEGLCVRLDRSVHLSPNTVSLVHTINEKLGNELKQMVITESKGGQCYSNKPATPRSHGIGYCRNMKQKVQRRFFPDSDKGVLAPPIRSVANNATCANHNGIFGNNKRRVQNIDWKMAEAIQQVNQLRLDGTPSSPYHNAMTNSYEAPSRGLK